MAMEGACGKAVQGILGGIKARNREEQLSWAAKLVPRSAEGDKACWKGGRREDNGGMNNTEKDGTKDEADPGGGDKLQGPLGGIRFPPLSVRARAG